MYFKRPLIGEDYVMDIDGNKVELPLDDAKELLFRQMLVKTSYLKITF